MTMTMLSATPMLTFAAAQSNHTEKPKSSMGNKASTTIPSPETTSETQQQAPTKVESQLNPEPERHNAGQPLQANLDSHGKQRSKFLTNCKKEHAASLNCIHENYDDRAACQPFFDAYKKCRKAERERHLEENAKHVKWWS